MKKIIELNTECIFDGEWNKSDKQINNEYLKKLSVDGTPYKYRVYYKTIWNNVKNPQILSFIMLNPSTATQHTPDPSVKNCINIAKKEDFDGIEVLNIYSLRHPVFNNIKEILENKGNPQNINYDFAKLKDVVLAWGDKLVNNNLLFDAIKKKSQNLYILTVADKNKISSNFNYTDKIRHPDNRAWSKLGGIKNAKLTPINKNRFFDNCIIEGKGYAKKYSHSD